MGFFDIGVDTSAKAAIATAPVTDNSSITFDSNEVIPNGENSISFTDELTTKIPNTVGEIFEAPVTENVILDSSVSLFAGPSDMVITEDSSITFGEETPAASSITFGEETPVVNSGIITEPEALLVEAPMTSDSGTLLFGATETSNKVSFGMPDMVDATPTVDESADITDADSTIKKAIVELESNASKIQAKVDAALLEESALLEKKSAAEAAHKEAMEALQKAAEAARTTANEIKKSGERTAELKKLLEAQLV